MRRAFRGCAGGSLHCNARPVGTVFSRPLMEERGYVVEALLERLRADGMPFRLIGDSSGFPETRAGGDRPRGAGAVARADSARRGRFAQEFDLRLVQLDRPRAPRVARGFRLDATRSGGRASSPRASSSRAADGVSADALFIAGLVDAVERRSLSEERATWLATLFSEEPRAATDRIGELLARRTPGSGCIAQAARSGEWAARALAVEGAQAEALAAAAAAARRAPPCVFTGREARAARRAS